ncbi:MAG: hypothetical protein GWN99_00945 [Gemmatimonadetes bacterium]|uniref:Inositolphosphotransferase Aur1/Ipt1 domain-containing protein n=1 Tax=Candidatus Kutchimonas denitrificans TaxID=3056748 RepID=A0AAE4ZCY2_9BACT|nr:hypothetical protein [Gemmatimonadota bacterium]NIR75655.1 hypothetical protein [Candidatus Kutchimonas denitrificans]NIR99634.1 hypothetical protein [Gemmatimonadota bacterium]NIT65909.1 hypothetical protein [Gemmatimonadota bacterium]NIV22078.1 hypothetical protein [Gemmatimonadota bacterium]
MKVADIITVAIVSVIVVTLAVRSAAEVPVADDLLLHGALLVGYAALIRFLSRFPETGWVSLVRGAAVIGVMFTLYTTLGHVAFEAIPWTGDAALASLDRVLFLGASPVLLMAPHIGPENLEIFAFIYALFIPYLYMSIFLGLIGRPGPEREAFVTGFALLYAASFFGYLFVPARGPVVYQAADFQSALSGGFFYDLVTSSIDRMGGPHGAFPSLHVGASVFACAFDLRHNRLRGLIYLPIVLAIAVSTVALRYHYVIDLLAGLALALLAMRLGHAWTASQQAGNGSGAS